MSDRVKHGKHYQNGAGGDTRATAATGAIATAADFLKLAESAELYGAPERVVLPAATALAGREFAVILRRPTAMLWHLKFNSLPDGERPQPPPEDAPAVVLAEPYQAERNAEEGRLSKALDEVINGMFVKPRLVQNPQGPDEVSPVYLTVLPKDDLLFLIGWAKGVVASDGSGLDTFRSRFAGAARGDGGAVRLPAERAAGTDHGSLAD